MAADWLRILLLYLILLTIIRSVFTWRLPFAPLLLRLAAARERRRARRRQAAPSGRPLEEIVSDLARLAPRFHRPVRGTSRTRIEAVRHAYDRALGEAAAALGIEHLLGVLEPGAELDRERHRVESRLWLAGIDLDDAA